MVSLKLSAILCILLVGIYWVVSYKKKEKKKIYASCFFIIIMIYCFLSLRTCKVTEDQVLAQVQVIIVRCRPVELNLHILL